MIKFSIEEFDFFGIASFGKAPGHLIDNINELDHEELTKILMDNLQSNIITRNNDEKAINHNLYLAGLIE
ncbi:hypothetical protein BpHYR1_016160 [Brachionus plicatilis]|uniref:Uncharacterized protein n=1 Tax=Brachionus plicatilis TaxID=10195 RepID=A0A3M7RP95_BRAPC|nr:hypothetical protein BpHYR1_016160 [Brachionus plicatilis]